MGHLNRLLAGKWLLLAFMGISTLASCHKEVTDDLRVKDMALTLKNGKSDPGLKNNTFKGPELSVGDGKARSFVTINHDGVPQEIGIVLTDEALSGLASVNTPYVLEFHHKALQATPFLHIALGWSANGHPLPGTFIGLHFDVRFFMMTVEDRLAIPVPPAAGFSNLPPAGYMPANYFPDAPAP